MSTRADAAPLLQVEGVRKYFPAAGSLPWSRARGYVRAVDGISFVVHRDETLSLVGESGCGKTTTAKLVLRLDEPTAGRIMFRGQDIKTLRGPANRRYRAGIQAVFQDPWSSLNPRMRVRDVIAEPLVVNQRLRRHEVEERVAQLLMAVGLEPAMASNFPHEFSGGQRQRIVVARALSLNPALIVLDEPVSALDVSIRAQTMNLLKDLQERFGMSYLLIAHDLATVRYLSRRVAVMYAGQIVESAPAEKLFAQPMHPYTQALIDAAAPARPGDGEQRAVVGGEVPSPINPPAGCRFHPRCPFAFDRCSREAPRLVEHDKGHTVACHLY